MGEFWKSFAFRSATLHNYLKLLTKKVNSNLVETLSQIMASFLYLLQPWKSSYVQQNHATYIKFETTEGQGHSHSGEIFCKSVLPPRFPVGEQITAKFHRVSDWDNIKITEKLKKTRNLKICKSVPSVVLPNAAKFPTNSDWDNIKITEKLKKKRNLKNCKSVPSVVLPNAAKFPTNSDLDNSIPISDCVALIWESPISVQCLLIFGHQNLISLKSSFLI